MIWVVIEIRKLIPNSIGVDNQRLAIEIEARFSNSILLDLTTASVPLELETADAVIGAECMLTDLEPPFVIYDFHSFKS